MPESEEKKCNVCNPYCYSCNPCCRLCDPCVLSQEVESEDSIWGAEIMAIPQRPPDLPMPPPICRGKWPQRRRIIPLLMEPKYRLKLKMPKICVEKRVKADKLLNTYKCVKANGVQDDVPNWFVLGNPFPRPGPGYNGRCIFFPRTGRCNPAPITNEALYGDDDGIPEYLFEKYPKEYIIIDPVVEPPPQLFLPPC